jgi:predicted nuclease of predicted toxin-antitoxin system
MKLLFDQNLSFRLVRQLRDVFPDSNQVRLLELDRAKDEKLWKYARDNDYVFVTQDVDYSHLSSLHGYPPKIIWLRCGNQPTAFIENLLRTNHTRIIQSLSDPDVGCLEIG